MPNVIVKLQSYQELLEENAYLKEALRQANEELNRIKGIKKATEEFKEKVLKDTKLIDNKVPRGYKKCPSCDELWPIRKKTCDECGYNFRLTKMRP